jgi:hypothetical protein
MEDLQAEDSQEEDLQAEDSWEEDLPAEDSQEEDHQEEDHPCLFLRPRSSEEEETTN